MSNLKQLELYRERRYSNRDLSRPSIEEHKNVLSDCLANQVVSYLENGTILWEFVSPTTDPYNSNDMIPNIIMSDGVYVWDGVIINWIKKYRIRLPEDFLVHLEKMKYIPRKLDQKSLIREFEKGADEIYL